MEQTRNALIVEVHTPHANQATRMNDKVKKQQWPIPLFVLRPFTKSIWTAAVGEILAYQTMVEQEDSALLISTLTASYHFLSFCWHPV